LLRNSAAKPREKKNKKKSITKPWDRTNIVPSETASTQKKVNQKICAKRLHIG
jgi:hypothetical protein